MNSSDGEENDTDGRSDVPEFDDDDSVADPDFILHHLSPDRSSLQVNQVMNENINDQHFIEQHMNNDIFESTATSHPSTSRVHISPDNSNISQQCPIIAPPDSDSDDDRDMQNNAGPRTGTIPTTERGMKERDEENGWNYNIQPLDRQIFCNSENFIQTEIIPENADVFTIFHLLIDDNVFDLMIEQTNLYAEQLIANSSGGRLSRWKPVNKEEMEKFMGIYLLTGIIRFRTLECYWKKRSHFLSSSVAPDKHVLQSFRSHFTLLAFHRQYN